MSAAKPTDCLIEFIVVIIIIIITSFSPQLPEETRDLDREVKADPSQISI